VLGTDLFGQLRLDALDVLFLLALVLAIVPIAALHWLFSGRRRLNKLQDRVKKTDFAFARQEDKIAKLQKQIKELEAQLRAGRATSAVAVTPAEASRPAEAPEPALAAAAPVPSQAAEAPIPGPEAVGDAETVPETPVETPIPAEVPKPAPSAPAPVPLRVAEAPSPRPEAGAERPEMPKPEGARPRPVEPVTLPRETRARPAPARRASRWSRLIQSLQAAARSEGLKDWESGVGKDDQRPAKKEPLPTILPEATAEAATARVEAAEWESRIGRRWLNVIGIVVLVVGIVLLIGYSLRYLGPPGRIGIGFATGAALLLGGWWLEKLERYHVFGLGPIGGGWALLYFTAYAAHNVEAARIIDNPVWALPLMVAVAAGMIAHSFRYSSQIVSRWLSVL
jgi:hypothetical protein